MTDKPKMTFIDCIVTSFLSVSFYFPFQPIIAPYCCCSCLPCHLSAAAVVAAQCLISINANDSKQQQKKASTFSNSSTCFFYYVQHNCFGSQCNCQWNASVAAAVFVLLFCFPNLFHFLFLDFFLFLFISFLVTLLLISWPVCVCGNVQ